MKWVSHIGGHDFRYHGPDRDHSFVKGVDVDELQDAIQYPNDTTHISKAFHFHSSPEGFEFWDKFRRGSQHLDSFIPGMSRLFQMWNDYQTEEEDKRKTWKPLLDDLKTHLGSPEVVAERLHKLGYTKEKPDTIVMLQPYPAYGIRPNVISTIKAVRKYTGMSLFTAKTMVEHVFNDKKGVGFGPFLKSTANKFATELQEVGNPVDFNCSVPEY